MVGVLRIAYCVCVRTDPLIPDQPDQHGHSSWSLVTRHSPLATRHSPLATPARRRPGGGKAGALRGRERRGRAARDSGSARPLGGGAALAARVAPSAGRDGLAGTRESAGCARGAGRCSGGPAAPDPPAGVRSSTVALRKERHPPVLAGSHLPISCSSAACNRIGSRCSAGVQAPGHVQRVPLVGDRHPDKQRRQGRRQLPAARRIAARSAGSTRAARRRKIAAPGSAGLGQRGGDGSRGPIRPELDA